MEVALAKIGVLGTLAGVLLGSILTRRNRIWHESLQERIRVRDVMTEYLGTTFFEIVHTLDRLKRLYTVETSTRLTDDLDNTDVESFFDTESEIYRELDRLIAITIKTFNHLTEYPEVAMSLTEIVDVMGQVITEKQSLDVAIRTVEVKRAMLLDFIMDLNKEIAGRKS